jgi:hypothetical protein
LRLGRVGLARLGGGPEGLSDSGLGFLGGWLSCRESSRLCLLDSLGFPWILSSESRLFNGLDGIQRGKFFRVPSAALRAPGREHPVVGIRKRRIVHGVSLRQFMIFCNHLSFEPFLHPPSSKSSSRSAEITAPSLVASPRQRPNLTARPGKRCRNACGRN